MLLYMTNANIKSNSQKSCSAKENHIKIKTISTSKLLYHFSTKVRLNDKHLYLHNNVKDFTNSTLSSYSGYQSSTRGQSYKGFIFTLKPKENLKFLDLSNKSITNIISQLQKIKKPEKYVKNQLNILNKVGRGRASVYNRMPNKTNFQDMRGFHISNRITNMQSQTFQNLNDMYKKLPRRIIQHYILQIIQEHDFDGIFEGNESYNSYVLFNTSKVNIQSKIPVQKY